MVWDRRLFREEELAELCSCNGQGDFPTGAELSAPRPGPVVGPVVTCSDGKEHRLPFEGPSSAIGAWSAAASWTTSSSFTVFVEVASARASSIIPW